MTFTDLTRVILEVIGYQKEKKSFLQKKQGTVSIKKFRLLPAKGKRETSAISSRSVVTYKLNENKIAKEALKFTVKN